MPTNTPSNATHIIEMELTEPIFYAFKKGLDIELELLRGEVKITRNGIYKCKIEVSDEKFAMFKALMKHFLSLKTNEVSVTLMGNKINLN